MSRDDFLKFARHYELLSLGVGSGEVGFAPETHSFGMYWVSGNTFGL